MGLIDSILAVVPETYRRDAMVLTLGATMAAAYFTFDARVAAAEAAAKPVADVQARIVAIERRQAVTDEKITGIQGSASRTEGQVNLLVQTLISQNSRGENVPAAHH
jgi:secreted trypsin-like serine protease